MPGAEKVYSPCSFVAQYLNFPYYRILLKMYISLSEGICNGSQRTHNCSLAFMTCSSIQWYKGRQNNILLIFLQAVCINRQLNFIGSYRNASGIIVRKKYEHKWNVDTKLSDVSALSLCHCYISSILSSPFYIVGSRTDSQEPYN